MDFRDWFSHEAEINRIINETARYSINGPFFDGIAHLSGQGLSQAIRSALAPVADELFRGIYAYPLNDYRNQMAPLLLDSIIRDNILDAGRAAYGLSLGIESVQRALLQRSQIGDMIPSWQIGSFIQPLPDLSPIEEWLKEQAAAKGKEALKESKYGFAADLLGDRFLVSIAEITQQVRRATVTNKLIAVTRRPEFEHELYSALDRSTLLGRRRSILESIFRAQRDREYLLSIPALLSQVEGFLGDALLLKGSVVSKGHKLYCKGPDGKKKRDRNNKEIVVSGVTWLLNKMEEAQ